jgi:hypothetical protein
VHYAHRHCPSWPFTPAGAAILPFTADAATLHLWHLDEASTPCADAAPGGTNLTRMINGATLGNAGYSNGTVNFMNCISFGTLTTAGAVIFPQRFGQCRHGDSIHLCRRGRRLHV